MRASRLLPLVPLLTGAPALAETGGQFRDWGVVCTVGLRCSASVFPEAGSSVSSLAFVRGAAGEAPLAMELRFAAQAAPAGAIRLRIDGGEGGALAPGEAARPEDGLVRVEGAPAAELLARLRDADEVVVEAEGITPATLSLRGLVAAMRRVDADQERTGTASALIDRGEAPLPDRARLPADVDDAAQLPAAVAASWRAAACEDGVDLSLGQGLGFSLPQDGEGRVYVLRCGGAGAYNAPSRVFVGSEDFASPLALATMAETGPTATLEVWNADWDGERLGGFFKGRGIGDCGVRSLWVFRPDAGDFVLSREWAKGECDGEGEGLDDWPQVWPAR